MTTKTLNQLNQLFRILGTWQMVACATGFNRATLNKWFAGTRIPTKESRDEVAKTYSMARKWKAA